MPSTQPSTDASPVRTPEPVDVPLALPGEAVFEGPAVVKQHRLDSGALGSGASGCPPPN